jgi:hypothetical protein
LTELTVLIQRTERSCPAVNLDSLGAAQRNIMVTREVPKRPSIPRCRSQRRFSVPFLACATIPPVALGQQLRGDKIVVRFGWYTTLQRLLPESSNSPFHPVLPIHSRDRRYALGDTPNQDLNAREKELVSA